MPRGPEISKLVATAKRVHSGKLWGKVPYDLTVGVIASVLGAALLNWWPGFEWGLLWNRLLSAVGTSWSFLTQPVQPPLIVLIVLAVPLAVGVVRYFQPRLVKIMSDPQASVDKKDKVIVGGLVVFGPVTYEVDHMMYYGYGPGFIARGPLCSKCLTEVTGDSGPSSYPYKCDAAGCGGSFSLPDSPQRLAKRAERVIEGAWRKVQLAGKEPVLDKHKVFDPQMIP